MKPYLYLFISFLAIFLSTCSNKPTQTTEAWLTKETKINLPSPHLEKPYHDKQLLAFNYNDQQKSLITLIDADTDAITVTGLSTLGIRLFNIEYSGNTIITEQNTVIKEIPSAEQILSDIMLSILPIESWRVNLPKSWQLVDNNLNRQLINDKGEIIIDIRYQQPSSQKIRRPTNIKHNGFNYQIAIEGIE
ncbi:DUF3261 domain-containing protein [Orbus wheelerorum]|uniref:DUF3261 domain-containing protein n=1 Tax=Orbus wheelerorum TaxID=3074111 RepID=UPI00370D8206